MSAFYYAFVAHSTTGTHISPARIVTMVTLLAGFFVSSTKLVVNMQGKN